MKALFHFFACALLIGAPLPPLRAQEGTFFKSIGGTKSAAAAPVTFTPLHTYYMAPTPTGNDSNNGTSPSTPWASLAHSMVCGDVVIAAPGTYGGQPVGTVSSCPSTSGGIDGTGGIYTATAVCNGNVGTCIVAGTVQVSHSNFAIEGFQANNVGGRCFFVDATASGTTRVGYVAFINDISNGCDDGYTTGDNALNHNVPGNGGDEFAVVGSIVYNSNTDPICVSALDNPGPANLDSIPGTHIFWYGNYIWGNNYLCNPSDGEGVMLDTLDAHGYTGQAVVKNNLVWNSARYNLQVFQQAYNSSAPVIKIYNNTSYSGFAGTTPGTTGGAVGDFNFQLDGGFPWNINIFNNIIKTQSAHGAKGTADVYAILVGGANPGAVVHNGGSGIQNILKGAMTSCDNSCDAGNNEVAFNSFSIGTNTYLDPLLSNTSDLLTSRSGAPACSSFVNATACMGWNANTQTLTTPSVIADLAPTATGTAGKGYQRPSTTCSSDADYPTWLKGIVYLQVSGGSTINQYPDLVSKPCGL